MEQDLYKTIIPPNNYESRRDFENESIIDGLSVDQKNELEELLINDLLENDDILIIQTLVYLNSGKSIDLILKKLYDSEEPARRIMIASYIYKLDDKKDEMITIARDSFLLVNDIYVKKSMFYYLSSFKNEKLNHLIEKHFNDENYLVSYNAKQALKSQ